MTTNSQLRLGRLRPLFLMGCLLVRIPWQAGGRIFLPGIGSLHSNIRALSCSLVVESSQALMFPARFSQSPSLMSTGDHLPQSYIGLTDLGFCIKRGFDGVELQAPVPGNFSFLLE